MANKEQAEAWDGHEGDVWTEHADRYDRASRRIWARFLAAGLVGVPDDVLDIGCGTGKSTRDVARIAVDGSALGVDLSSRMLALARERATAEGVTNATFLQGDAQVHPFEAGAFDLAISSFGGMFFDDPVAAYSNVARALRPGGRLALLGWRDLAANEWLMGLRGALALGRELPTPPPDAPTPFSLADPDRVRARLGAAGFTAIELAPIDEPIDLGADTDDAYAFACTMGIVEGLLHDVDEAQRGEAMAQVRAMLAAHETAEGVLVGAAAWLITAERA